MISSKDLFFEERSAETYEEVMNWENRKPAPVVSDNELTLTQQIQQKELEILKLKREVSKLLKEFYSFENKQNAPEFLIQHMKENINYPFCYLSYDKKRIRSSFKYQGETNYLLGSLYRNPFFDWDGPSGIRPKKTEKDFNRKYYS